MRSGKLRHKLIIESNTPTRSTKGEKIDAWSTFSTVWGSVEPISGKEYFAIDKINTDVDYRIKIRHLPGITSSMRVTFGTRSFDILSILNIMERNREIHLMCKERL